MFQCEEQREKGLKTNAQSLRNQRFSTEVIRAPERKGGLKLQRNMHSYWTEESELRVWGNTAAGKKYITYLTFNELMA